MKKAIEYLLLTSGISNYQISKATGISAVILGKYTNGKSDVGKMTLDNAEKLYNYYEEMKTNMENKFGSVNFEGKTYILLEQADFTNRQLLDWQTEDGYAEFSAPALDDEGNPCIVCWVQQIKDMEDLSDLDWNKPDRVVAE